MISIRYSDRVLLVSPAYTSPQVRAGLALITQHNLHRFIHCSILPLRRLLSFLFLPRLRLRIPLLEHRALHEPLKVMHEKRVLAAGLDLVRAALYKFRVISRDGIGERGRE